MMQMTISDGSWDFSIPAPPPAPASPFRPRRAGALRASLLGGAAICAIGAALAPAEAQAQVHDDRTAPQGATGGYTTYVVYTEGHTGGTGGTPAPITGSNLADIVVSGTQAVRLTSQGGKGGTGGNSGALVYSIGGDGGTGGAGGYIDYVNAGDLTVTNGVGLYAAFKWKKWL